MTLWAAIDTESVSDSGSSLTVLAVSLTLVALGVVLLVVTVWFWRLTRPDPDALGPLVVMSDRDFLRRGPIEQRRALDAARPDAIVIDAPDEPVGVDDVDLDTPAAEAPFVEPEAEFEVEPEPDDWELDGEVDSETGNEMDEDPSPATRPTSIDPLL